MKRLIIFSVVCFLAAGLNATTVPSGITEVTVFRSGAKITRVAEVTVQKGMSEIVLGNLTNSLQQNTLQVNVNGEAVLLSANSRINYLTEQAVSDKIKRLTDSLEMITRDINWNNKKLAVYKSEEQVVQSNNKLGSEQTGMTVNELRLLADFYRTRLLEIHEQVFAIERENEVLKNKKQKLENQLNDLRNRNHEPTGEVVIHLSADKAVRLSIEFSYITANAGWMPLYDIRSDEPGKPVQLIYKANVKQHTGFDWEETDLTISTGNPYMDNNRPLLNPWYIDFLAESPPVPLSSRIKATREAPAANLALEVVRFKEKADAGYDVQLTENRITAEYCIEANQTIPADNKEHMVAMKQYMLPAEFIYHTVPKLSDGVFLLAKVADYGQYNLLPGESNLFFQGMYVGQSYINPRITADSLLISLGRDDKISVERNILKDLTSRQTIGSNIKETKGIEINIRNNNNYPVEIEVLDQVPIPSNKDISVSIEDKGGAQYTEELGKLLWRLKLNAGESAKLGFSFSVKYPKDKQIPGL